ncbi:MAG: [protein-PII] uridylyltransferase [Rhizobiaceae bacterium]
MAATDLRLSDLIDAQDLREKMSAFVKDGEGSDTQIRAEVLALLKRANKDGRTKAEELLFEDGNGTACARRISYLQDELIGVIYNFAITHVYSNNNATNAEKMAICAVGGYGRGTLAPGSDIDLLFVLPYKQTAWGESVVEYILYMLWDMGFKVGHATRNIDECIRLSLDDMTIRTSILEMRYIWGSKELSKELSKKFQNEIVANTAHEFIAAKLEERDHRHKKSGESRYRVEPNIKDGKGGLRDLHTLFWISKYFFNVGKSRELVKLGFFTKKEYRTFRATEKFLWTVRCHMHFLTGRAEERLSFELQSELATRLKYTEHGGLLDVERFMKHYFLVAKEVGDLTLIACSALEEREAKEVGGIRGLFRSVTQRPRKIKGHENFIRDHGRINVANMDVFKNEPVNMIRLFKVADENDLDFHPDVMHLLSKSMKLVDKNFRKNPEAVRLFLDVVTTKNGPEAILRRMNESGFLGRFIPAFGKIVAMMQFNMYHHFTVDEHLIQSVGALWGIESGKLAEEHPLSAELLPDIKDRELLYVALLIHDIAKGRKEDHSIAGARIAKSLCPRLGMSKEQTEMISWLVLEHLTMSNIAQSRDLSDRKTITDFAETVQTVERMRYLLILTVCDIRAVGPGVWNGWKGQLLRTLYYETEPILTGGFSKVSTKSRLYTAKGELDAALESWDAATRERITDLPYPAYFLSTDKESQIRHMEFLLEIEESGKPLATSVHTREFEAVTEITLVAPDHPRLLSIIAGACNAAGANIVDAKIHTTHDGRALDSIFINREFDNDEDEIRRTEKIGAIIENVLTGKTRLPEIILQRSSYKQAHKAFSVPAKVTIDNDLSDDFSVIEIECLDRPGLLSQVTRQLADLNLDIGSAHIATFGEKASDSFYVNDLIGHKITSPQRQRKIKEALMAILENKKKPELEKV